ncbi:hypothetical protein N183_10005 [Sinorhizobium sp. Sb3]|nr:hypothetical protein N183_10005 [Sinorhizobium sp. Sb3]
MQDYYVLIGQCALQFLLNSARKQPVLLPPVWLTMSPPNNAIATSQESRQ